MPGDAKRLPSGTISGVELVRGTAWLARMNLLLHGIGEPGGRHSSTYATRWPGRPERTNALHSCWPIRRSGASWVQLGRRVRPGHARGRQLRPQRFLGHFYAGGVKTNVLFFDSKPARPELPWTSQLWGVRLPHRPAFHPAAERLRVHHLDDFVKAYNPEDRLDRKESRHGVVVHAG